jgi:hypothetical protein
MAGKEPTAGQPYRAGDTTPTPWAEARERLADADTYWLAGAKQLPFARVLGHPHAAVGKKKAGECQIPTSPASRGTRSKGPTPHVKAGPAAWVA